MKCHHCPHLDASRMPPGWKPAAACCIDQSPGHRALAEREAARRSNLTADSFLPSRRTPRPGERAYDKVRPRD